MQFRRNSTIGVKQKICQSCGKPCYWFSKKRCKQCATIEQTYERMQQETDEYIDRNSLSDIIRVADEWFSKYVRLMGVNEEGLVSCYTCDDTIPWQKAQCGHYIKRGCLYLRHDTRNGKIQCETCNVFMDGNMAEYTQRMERDFPGLPDILREESMVVYKPDRDELQRLITEYSIKSKQLIKKIE